MKQKNMKKNKLQINAVLISLLLATSQASIASDNCGSKEGVLNDTLRTVVIPDYFPADAPALRDVFSSEILSRMDYCGESFGEANLGQSCVVHDACYDTLGSSKKKCDKKKSCIPVI